jgi:rare lipoprotein A
MKRVLLIASLVSALSACTTVSDLIPTSISSSDSGDSAPQERRDVSQIADAQPQPVIRTRAGNKSPYTVLGKTYTLLPESEGYKEQGGASWYGTKFHGRRTANGEVYDMWGMTAAHKTLPIPSYVRVTNMINGRSVVVLVNDRGPFHSERIIDLSYAAAVKLGFADQGVADVEVVDVTPLEQSAKTPLAVTVIPSNAKTVVAPYSAPVPARASSVPAATPSTPAAPKEVVVAAPVASKPPVSDTPSPAENSQPAIYLQAAAFKSLESAQKLQKKLQEKLSSPVFVVPSSNSTSNNNIWHRVRVGPLAGVQKVSEARQILSEQGIKKPQVVKAP